MSTLESSSGLQCKCLPGFGMTRPSKPDHFPLPTGGHFHAYLVSGCFRAFVCFGILLLCFHCFVGATSLEPLLLCRSSPQTMRVARSRCDLPRPAQHAPVDFRFPTGPDFHGSTTNGDTILGEGEGYSCHHIDENEFTAFLNPPAKKKARWTSSHKVV